MNKKLLFILNSIMSVIVILGLIYLGLDYCYKDTFVCGTYINGVYCAGMTPEEVNDVLKEDFSYEGIKVVSADTGLSFTLDLSDCSPQSSYIDGINAALTEQKTGKWYKNLFADKVYTVEPVFTYDKTALNEKMNSYSLLTYSEQPSVEMTIDDTGISLSDNMQRRPDSDAIRNAIIEGVSNMASEILIDDKFFYDEKYSSQQNETRREYDHLKDFLGARITYVMGEDKEVIDEAVLYSFLLKNEKDEPVTDEETGDYVWNDEAIENWIDELAAKYDTVGKTRQFNATGGYTVTVEGGTYGNKIDSNIEKEYLKQAVRDGLVEEHEPEYSQKAVKQGLDDIGDTYIEVNMTEQKLYYYVDGELIIDSPVVTGNMARRCDTPSGTNYVYYMQRNRTLIGPNYQTFVYYWIAVVGHIGIHDATWRSEFGDDIYLTDGSHGCINTPTENVSKLYDLVELGTPAVMFYMEDDAKEDISD